MEQGASYAYDRAHPGCRRYAESTGCPLSGSTGIRSSPVLGLGNRTAGGRPGSLCTVSTINWPFRMLCRARSRASATFGIIAEVPIVSRTVRAHEVHLSELAIEILTNYRGCRDGVTRVRGRSPATTYSQRAASDQSPDSAKRRSGLIGTWCSSARPNWGMPEQTPRLKSGLDPPRPPANRRNWHGPAEHRSARSRPDPEPRLWHDQRRRCRLQPSCLS